MTRPLVSVVIPTFNRKDYVQEAIDSVLAQTYANHEIIVVDDGSSDGTGEALQARYGDRIRYEWQENQGESAARNRGIALAQGEYVAFLDSDDLWLPYKLELQAAAAQNGSDPYMSVCAAWRIDALGHRLPGDPLRASQQDRFFSFGDLLRQNVLGPAGSSAFINRPLLDRVGGFDRTLSYGEDWEMWLRISQHCNIWHHAEPLLEVRVHANAQQHRHLNTTEVNTRLEQHLRLLSQTQRQSPHRVSDSVFSEAIGLQYLRASIEVLAAGDRKQSRDYLERTWQLSPKLCTGSAEYGQLVINSALQVAQVGDGMQPTRALAFAEQALALRDDVIRPGGKRHKSPFDLRLLSKLHIDLGFLCHSAGKTRKGGPYMVRGIMLHPPYARNLGVLSVMAEALVGSYMTNAIRRYVRPRLPR